MERDLNSRIKLKDNKIIKKDNKKILSIKRSLIFNFGTMTIPIRQWLYYIIYPLEIKNIKTGIINDNSFLKSKAFSILFMCILDVLKEEKKIRSKFEILEQYDIHCSEFKSIVFKLLEIYKMIFSKFTFEEQLFIRNKRLQNVHGVLSIYDSEKPKVPYFDKTSQKVKVKYLSREKYREILNFFSDKNSISIEILIQKFIKKDQNDYVIDYLEKNIRDNQRYVDLIRKISEEINFKIEIMN